MNFRPAGESSDEDDEFNNFSFAGEIKTEKEKHREIAAELYRKQHELNETSVNRLYSAIINANVKYVQKELDGGVDVNCHITSDWTPVFLAASLGHSNLVEELLKRGADATITRDGFSSLMSACNCTKNTTSAAKITQVVQLLLAHGISPKLVDRKRRTALMLASAQGFPEVVSILLPVSDLETEDNQGWTALFYAANANEPEIVKLLLDSGSNLNHFDVRNNDVKYYVTLNDYQEVLKVFPEEDKEITEDDLCSYVDDYENMFEFIEDDERPDFFKDITFMLYGMKCEHIISLIRENNIDLSTFLTINNSQLEELGIKLSFHRNRILQGLYRFHQRPWKKGSIAGIVSRDNTYTTYDLFVMCVNAVKHLTVIESTLKYLKQDLPQEEMKLDEEIIVQKIRAIRKKTNRIQTAISVLLQRTHKIDTAQIDSADVITKNFRFKNNRLRRKVVFGAFGVVITIITIRFWKFCTS